MAKQNSDKKTRRFRILLADDETHRQMWIWRFSRFSFFSTIITVICVFFACTYLLIAVTPLKTFIPGYPDAESRRAAISNAMKIDSLQRVVTRWEFYSENIRRVIAGEDPIVIDSIIRRGPVDSVNAEEAQMLHRQDSVLRQNVAEAEQFGLTAGKQRELPIEGMHFFTPLKGVVSQEFDPNIHPYIDITAPAGSVVMSVLDGTVIGAGWSDDGGYTIQIQHSGDLVSVYKHNEKLLRGTGDKVAAGSSIALVGNTGALTTGDHLHFELWYKGEAVDPTLYIKF